jgi:hypothetical protein
VKRRSSIPLLFAALFFNCGVFAQHTIRLSEQNHHYLEYNQKPIVLITSGEHYGALINLDFDYISYFNALEKQGMNNSRIFSGAYVEGKKDIKFMQYNNTLAPKDNRLIAPWQRSGRAEYIHGGAKFDLDSWDEKYFIRLKDLLQEAGRRGIMIEFTLFGNQYGDSIYSYSPLYADNNIQGVGKKGKNRFLDFQSMKDPALVRRQDDLVVKMVNELNTFDNLYYEISNEPYNEVKDSSVVDKWHRHLATLIRKTEKSLPKKHLIASNQAIVDDKKVDIANYHYVHISNIPDFDSLLRLNKVISMDETMGSLHDADVNDVRVEAWDFILHGGGAYNNLSWEYSPTLPGGTAGADTVRVYLQHLQQFISGFNFVHMKYSPDLLVTAVPEAIARVLAEAGKQYAIYIHHSKPAQAVPKRDQFISKYEANNGSFRDTISISLPAGTYTVHWFNPAAGTWAGKASIHIREKTNYRFFTGLYTTDIALSILRK